MTDFPEGLIKYSESPLFTAESVPDKLLNAHATKDGVWGKLQVLEGSLHYIVLGPPASRSLIAAGQHGVIEPTVPHHLELAGPVSFKVEFYR